MKSNYFAVIFSSTLADLENVKYHQFSKKMFEEVQHASGFLGMESYRESNGKGVTISYWETEADIEKWKINTEHLLAKKYGKQIAYLDYQLRICEVKRAYDFSQNIK
ncbi:MAG: antibiotic biosynthesis monooxygenase [Flavobacteriaceae bacterium]|jgi:heme-degrading monooxygenase HmoA